MNVHAMFIQLGTDKIKQIQGLTHKGPGINVVPA